MAGETATREQIAALRTQLGLDKSLPEQYAIWLTQVLRGDLGRSAYLASSVAELIREGLPQTLRLGSLSLLFAVVVAIPLGILGAVRPDSWVDRLGLAVAVSGQAIPTFWLGILLILLFGITLGWLPISGSSSWLHFILPAAALGYHAVPPILRLTRTSMLDVLGADYIRTAHAKGLHPLRVIVVHAFRNALIPVIALLSVQFGHMLSGSIIVESVFAIDGIGLLAWESIKRNDIQVVQGLVAVVAAIYICLVTLADILTGWIDPRIRTG
jgi:peptide/nickel transport system permease protein